MQEHLAKVDNSDKGIAVSGKLVFATVASLTKNATNLLESHQSNSLEIDCKNVTRVDSAGIALMLDWQRTCNQINKKCSFIGLSQQAKSLLKAYRLDNVLSS